MRDTTPKMTRQDFQFIADTILGLEWYCAPAGRNSTKPASASSLFTRHQLNVIAEHFARELRATNPNFKYDTFVAAATRVNAVVR